jgi:type III secretory pathway component EscV
MLCEYVRVDLGRFICQKFIDDRRGLRVITLDASTETQLRSHVQQGANGAYLAMPPEASRELLLSVGAAVTGLPSGVPAVLLATMETRRFLRRLLAQPMPQLHILSYPELPADVQIQPVGRIVLPQRAALRVAGV